MRFQFFEMLGVALGSARRRERLICLLALSRLIFTHLVKAWYPCFCLPLFGSRFIELEAFELRSRTNQPIFYLDLEDQTLGVLFLSSCCFELVGLAHPSLLLLDATKSPQHRIYPQKSSPCSSIPTGFACFPCCLLCSSRRPYSQSHFLAESCLRSELAE